MRKTVAFGFVGTVLDYAGRGSQRWSKWRPTLCLCQQESLVIDRLELLHDDRSNAAIANGKQNLMFLFIFKLCFCSNYLLLTKHNANHILTGRHT